MVYILIIIIKFVGFSFFYGVNIFGLRDAIDFSFEILDLGNKIKSLQTNCTSPARGSFLKHVFVGFSSGEEFEL